MRSCKKYFALCFLFTAKLLVRAVRAVVCAVTQLLGRQADGVVRGTHVVRQLAHQRLTVVLV